MLGLSFKSDTDDLRENPYVTVVKRLIGEGCDIRIWGPNGCLGVRIGSNRQFIQQIIPHIGKLLTDSLDEVLGFADTVVLATNSIQPEIVRVRLRTDQRLVNLVQLEPRYNVDRVSTPVGA
jgi:GDP-mannose 6-dehydrogenase